MGIEVLTDGFGNPIGVAHVELATQLAAQTALALSGDPPFVEHFGLGVPRLTTDVASMMSCEVGL